MKTSFTICKRAFLLAALFLAGCFSIERGQVRTTGEEHILVSNYGWYLFNCIPLASGNTNPDPIFPWVIFRNDVTMEKVQTRFMGYVNGMKKDAKNLTYTSYDSVMFEIPGSNIPVPIPYLLTYREIQLSGVLIDKKETAK